MLQWPAKDENIRIKHISTPQGFLNFFICNIIFLEEAIPCSVSQIIGSWALLFCIIFLCMSRIWGSHCCTGHNWGHHFPWRAAGPERILSASLTGGWVFLLHILLAASRPLLFDPYGNKSPLPLRLMTFIHTTLYYCSLPLWLASWPRPFFTEDSGNCTVIFLSTPIPSIVMGNIHQMNHPPARTQSSFFSDSPWPQPPFNHPHSWVRPGILHQQECKFLYPTMT